MLTCLEHNPASPDCAIIWMHGLGASYTDFLSLIPMLGQDTARFTFPQAPDRAVTINGGMRMPAWYDIITMERTPEREPADQVRASSDKVAALIERELSRGTPAHRIVLAGFSQGAALALHQGQRSPHKLAGIMALSGYPVDEHTLASEASEANKMTPIYSGHGRQDEVVPFSEGVRAREMAQRLSPDRQLTACDYQMGHELCAEQVRDLRGWLQQVLR